MITSAWIAALNQAGDGTAWPDPCGWITAPRAPAGELDAAGVVSACKNLKYAERDFRPVKSGDLDLRPVVHRLEERIRARVLICMLACYLTWHLRRA